MKLVKKLRGPSRFNSYYINLFFVSNITNPNRVTNCHHLKQPISKNISTFADFIFLRS